MAEKVRCIIICGAPDCDAELIRETVRPGDFVICADKGFEYAKKAGVGVDLFVGDFDSFGGEVPDGVEVIKLKVHKDDSDSMHCASVAIERGFKEAVLLCAVGGRTDHSFSNFCVLGYLESNGVTASIVTKTESVMLLTEGEYSVKNRQGSTFSLFPFGCDKAVVSYVGSVEYPARNLTLKAFDSLGLSNIFNCNDVSIIISEGSCLLFIETDL